MTAANTLKRYGSVAMTFHWLIAFAVILNICLGLYMSDLPRGDPNLSFILQTHKSIGLTVLVLSLGRLGWRLANPIPPLPATMNPLLRRVARGTHYLLYFLIIFIPLSGWALVSASSHVTPIVWFGLFQWPHIPFLADLPHAQRAPLHRDFDFVHVYLAWSAIVLVPIHIAGALYHQFVRGDDVLKRMLPGARISKVA
ncbi:MAG TPA: cytochrome b [Rhizomicrobium sp.]